MSDSLPRPSIHLQICVLFALALLLFSCTPAEGPRAPSTQTVVVLKHGKLSGNPAAFAAILRTYEQLHPGIVIRDEILPASTDQQHQFYAINLEGRQPGFDVLAADVIWVQEFAQAGWLQPLDDLATGAASEAWFPSALKAATLDGRLYALPWYMDAGVLYYRQDLLARYGFTAPHTWAELIEMAQVIMNGEHDPQLAGFIWQGKQYEGVMCSALEFLWSHGGDLTMNQPDSTERGLAFMRRLMTDKVSPPIVATADEEVTRHLFGAGRAVFMRNWPYAWSLFQRADSPMRGKVGMTELPSAKGGESTSVLGGWMLAVPQGAEHPKEAAELIRFLAGEDAQRRMAQDIGYKPALRSLYHDTELLRRDPELAQLYPIFLAARPRPVTPYYLMLSQAWQPEISAVVVGLKSPREAMASAARQAALIMDMANHVATLEPTGSSPRP